LENLEEMDKFLDTSDHPKLKQEEINHLDRSTTQNENEAALECLKKRKVNDLMDYLLNFTRYLKKN
jgi:hypothetical protein